MTRWRKLWNINQHAISSSVLYKPHIYSFSLFVNTKAPQDFILYPLGYKTKGISYFQASNFFKCFIVVIIFCLNHCQSIKLFIFILVIPIGVNDVSVDINLKRCYQNYNQSVNFSSCFILVITLCVNYHQSIITITHNNS